MDVNIQSTIAEEQAAKEILKKRIEGLKAYSANDTELLSYRLAEIMVLAKDLYTRLFPELIHADSSNEKDMWNEIMGIRMHLMHLRDCIDEFDANLLELMENRDDDTSDTNGEDDPVEIEPRNGGV